jgi:hypothetical protein
VIITGQSLILKRPLLKDAEIASGRSAKCRQTAWWSEKVTTMIPAQ